MATPLPQYRVPLPDGHEIRVFLSSTFRDMDGERTALVNLFKRLKPAAAEHGVSITLVDLRWGITEEESKTGKVIEICLDEIIKSRPFFIGMVGDRYGWCPTRHDVAGLLTRPGFEWLGKDLDTGLSVTEIEMQYGVLRNPHTINASFFLRTNTDKQTGDNQEATGCARLRDTLLTQDRYPVALYSTPDDLATQVESQFLEYLDRLFPDKITTENDAIELVEQQRRNRLLARCHPREEWFGWLHDMLDKPEIRIGVVSGIKGYGKSTLLAYWSEMLNWDKGDRWHPIYHDISPAYANAGHMASMLGRKIRNTLLVAGDTESAAHLTVPHAGQQSLFNAMLRSGELDSIASLYGEQTENNIREMAEDDFSVKTLASLNEKVAVTGKRFAIFIDNADLVNEDIALLTTFLQTLPDNVKVFITLNELFESITGSLAPHTWVSFRVDRLNEEDKKHFIERYLRHFSKRLDRDQTETVLQWPLSGNPANLSVLLSELIIFGDYSRLDKHIRRYTSATSELELYTKVLHRLCESIVGDIASPLLLLTLTSYGLSEYDIKHIAGISQVVWSQLRAEFEPWLDVTDGYYRISNPVIVKAITQQFDPHGCLAIPLRRKILDATSPDNRQQLTFADYNFRQGKFVSHVHYHHIAENICMLLSLGEYDTLYRRLADAETFEVLFRGKPALLTRCWKHLMESDQTYTPEVYLNVDINRFESQMRPVILNDIARFLSMDMRMPQTAIAIGQRIDKLNGIPPTAQSVLRMNQGCREARAGNYANAIQIFNEVVEAQQLLTPRPDKEIANTYGNLAFAYYFANRENEAIPCFMHVIDYHTTHQESESTSKIADAAHFLGHCHICADNYPAAIPFLRKASHSYDSMPDVPVKKKIRTLRWLAYSLHKTKAESEALEVLHQVLPSAMDAELTEDVKYCHKLYFYILQSRLQELKSQGRQDTPESDICYYEMLLHEWWADREGCFIAGKVRYVPLLRTLLDLLDDARRNEDSLRIFNTLDNGDLTQSPNDRAMIYHYAAMAAFRLEDHSTALKYFDWEYDYRKENLVPDSYFILAMQNLAVCRHFTGDSPAALTLLHEALSLEAELHGDDTRRAATLREYIDIVSKPS